MGEQFAGRYELIDLIGQGGMGSIWRVRDLRTDEVVAGKILRQSDGGALLRFMREQGVRIDHEHVVTPLGWAGEDGRLIFTMPLITGGSLEDLLADYPNGLPWRFVAEVLRGILSGLQACADAHVVHRDIKPANILLEATGQGRPRALITDFGIALSSDAPRLTHHATVLGTQGYIAPEQARGEKPDPRADLYSAGVVGLQMVTGREPSDAGWSRPANVPDELWTLLIDLTDEQPEKRPSASEALQRLSGGREASSVDRSRTSLAWQEPRHEIERVVVPDRMLPVEESGTFTEGGVAHAKSPGGASPVGRSARGQRARTTGRIVSSTAPMPVVPVGGSDGAGGAHPTSVMAVVGEKTETSTSHLAESEGAIEAHGAKKVEQTKAGAGSRGRISAWWYALPLTLAALVAILAVWQPWSGSAARSTPSDPHYAVIGAACLFGDVGTTSATKDGTSATCTYVDGKYLWQKTPRG